MRVLHVSWYLDHIIWAYYCSLDTGGGMYVPVSVASRACTVQLLPLYEVPLRMGLSRGLLLYVMQARGRHLAPVVQATQPAEQGAGLAGPPKFLVALNLWPKWGVQDSNGEAGSCVTVAGSLVGKVILGTHFGCGQSVNEGQGADWQRGAGGGGGGRGASGVLWVR